MVKTEQYTEYKDRGITGLKNLGNTCFMNSAIHCLTHTYEFSRFLDSKTEQFYNDLLQKNEYGIILKEWNDLRTLMFSENCNISPGGFLTNVQKIAVIKDRQIFTGFAQNDLTEFILFICDCFHEALKRPVKIDVYGQEKNKTDSIAKKCYKMVQDNYKDNYSEIYQMFYSIQVSNIYEYSDSTDYDQLCSMPPLSTRPESIFMLDLCIPENECTVYECIEKHCKPELLNGDNKWFNEDKNEKQDVLKQYSFFNLPEVLIISLKRFNHHVNKNNTYVKIDVNEHIDFSKFVCGYNPQQYKYEVFAVCNHYGSIMGGHYTTTVKNASGKWYSFNDLEKNEVDDERVITPNMYCLFLRKV